MVSSKDIQVARRSAKRTRALSACMRCKRAKIKCSDFRPCRGSTDAQIGASCRDTTTTTKKSIACSKKKKIESESDSTKSSKTKVADAATSDNANNATIQTSTVSIVSDSEAVSDPRQQQLVSSSSYLPGFSALLDVVVPSHLAFTAQGLGLVSDRRIAPETAIHALSRFTAIRSSMPFMTDRGSPFHHQPLAPAWPLAPLPPPSYYQSSLCPPFPSDSESSRINGIPLLMMLATNAYTHAHDHGTLRSWP